MNAKDFTNKKIDIISEMFNEYLDSIFDDSNKFGLLLKQKRIALNLKQHEVESSCKLSQSTVSRIENGKSAYFNHVAKLYRFYRKIEVNALEGVISELNFNHKTDR